MKSRFFKAALAVVSACTLMACSPEKESNAAQGAATPAVQPATETASAAQQTKDENMNKLTLTAEWDKVFPKSDKVEHSKVTFKNHFGIELAADMFVSKDTSLKVNGKFPAIAVSGPFGAVKEQWRIGRRAALHEQPGHQHRRLHGVCRFPLDPRQC